MSSCNCIKHLLRFGLLGAQTGTGKFTADQSPPDSFAVVVNRAYRINLEQRMHLGFVCEWLPQQLEATWSGTPYHLRAALIEHGLQIYDINLGGGQVEGYLLRLLNARYHWRQHRLYSRFRLSPLTLTIQLSRFRSQWRRVAHLLDALLVISDGVEASICSHLPIGWYGDCTHAMYYQYEYDPIIQPRLPIIHSHRQHQRRIQWQQEFFAAAQVCCFMSQWAQRSAIEADGLPAEKAVVVYPGINVPVVESAERPLKRPYLLFVGRDFFRKGGDLVVEAYRRMRYRTECDLVVAGVDRHRSYSSVPGVHFLGNVPYKTLSPYFLHAEAFVMPSFFEPFGLVIIEALSYGVPVIGRNAFAMPELIEHGRNGLLMETRSSNVDELVTLMEQVLTDSTLRANARADASRVRAFFTWRRAARQILEHLQPQA